MFYENFRKGINLGGWLSQYEFIAKQPLTREHLSQHFNSFIVKTDIQRIASWGFDHVRLPVSGYLIYDPESQSLNQDIVEKIYHCISWCEDCSLNIVLDLHDVWGNVYGAMEELMPLLSNEDLQKRFINIWALLTKEFKDVRHPTLLFELLNEVSDASGSYSPTDVTGNNFLPSDIIHCKWNILYKQTIRKIRQIDSKRWILVGSNGQNSVVYLKELFLIDDPNVFYNFHFYDPQVFTHQRAHFLSLIHI